MTYNFDEIVERRGTHSYKWDYLEELFGDEKLLSMWVADMDFKSPEPVIEAIIERARHGVFGYTGREDGFYQSVMDWLCEQHGWETEKEWFVTTPGVLTAVFAAVDALTEPGDNIVLQPPVYYPFFSVIEENGRHVKRNPLKIEDGKYVMDFDNLKELVDDRTRMLILCSPHNPVSRVWEKETLQRLGRFCLENDIFVLSDEIHSDLVFAGNQHTPFLEAAPEFSNNSLVTVSPSKTFNLAGLSISSMVIPDESIRKRVVAAVNSSHHSRQNLFGIEAFEVAYKQGREWYEQMMAYVWENYRFMVDFIQERLPRLKVFPLEGTYLVWVDFRGLGKSTEEIGRICLKEAGLALDEGHIFGPEGEGFQRFNIACSRKLLKEAMERLEKAIKDQTPAPKT